MNIKQQMGFPMFKAQFDVYNYDIYERIQKKVVITRNALY